MADVVIKFGATLDDLMHGVDQVNKTLDGLSESVSAVNEKFRGLAEIVGISLSIEGVKSFIEGMANLGAQTERTAQIFGITTEEVGRLQFIAQATGGTADGLTHSLEAMALRIEQAGSKATPTGAALRALGISAQSLIGLPLPDLLDRLRDKFSALPDGMQKTAIAQALVKGGAQELLPVLNLSNEKWQELIATFDQTGAALSGRTASAFDETDVKLLTLRDSVEGLGIRIFSTLEPAIDAGIEKLTEFVQSIDSNKIQQAAMTLVTWSTAVIEEVGNLAIEVNGIIDQVMTKLTNFGQKFGHVLQLSGAGAAIGAGMGAVGGGVGAVPAAIIGAGVGGTVGLIQNFFTGVNSEVAVGVQDTEALKKRWDAAVQGIGDSIKNTLTEQANASRLDADLPGMLGDWAKPKGAGTGGIGLNFDSSGVQAQMAAAEGLVASLKSGFAATEAGLQSLLAMHKITAQQAVTFEKQALDQQLADTLAAYQKELAIAGLTAAERQQIENKITEAKAAAAAKREEIDQQEAVREFNLWSQGFQNFFSMIDEASQRATSFGDAFRIVVDDMVKNFIQGLEKMLAEWIAKTGIMQSLGFIGNIIGLAFGIPSFDVGAWNLPSDMVAQVHKGEMIIPADAAGALRSAMSGAGGSPGGVSRGVAASSGGGGDTHVHLHLIDATGAREFIKQYAGDMAKATGNFLSKNHSTREAFSTS